MTTKNIENASILITGGRKQVAHFIEGQLTAQVRTVSSEDTVKLETVEVNDYVTSAFDSQRAQRKFLGDMG